MRRQGRDTRQRLDIEVFGDGIGVDVREVSFGRGSDPDRDRSRTGRHPSPWRTPALVGAAVGLLAGAVAFGAGRTTPSVRPGSAAAVTTTAPAPPVTEAPSQTATNEPTTTSGPLVAELTGGRPVVPGLSGPVTLYLADSSGSTVITVDLQTGHFAESAQVDGRVGGMIRTSTGFVPLVVAWSDPAQVALGPQGTYWIQDPSSSRIVQMDASTGAELATLSAPFGSDSTFGAYLLGSLPNGDPVVYGPDGGTFALHGDGSPPTRVTHGPATFDRSGSFAENLCSDTADCVQRLHLPNGTTVDLPLANVWVWSFSPNSRWVLSSDGDKVWLTDLATAEQQRLGLPGSLLVDDYGTGPASVWTPDGDHAVFSGRFELLVLDPVTGETTSIDLPRELGPYRVVGVG